MSISHGRKIKGPDGTIYNNTSECSAATGLTRRVIGYNLKNKPEAGFTYASEPRVKKVIGPDGTIYNSLRSCGKALDRDAKTIKNWIENYPELGYKFLNN